MRHPTTGRRTGVHGIVQQTRSLDGRRPQFRGPARSIPCGQPATLRTDHPCPRDIRRSATSPIPGWLSSTPKARSPYSSPPRTTPHNQLYHELASHSQTDPLASIDKLRT